MKVYSGADNGITISRVYSIKFYCDYQMAWYPFDQQVCMVDMVMDGVLDNYADLLPGALHFSGPKELTQYYVKTFKIKKSEVQDKVAVGWFHAKPLGKNFTVKKKSFFLSRGHRTKNGDFQVSPKYPMWVL